MEGIHDGLDRINMALAGVAHLLGSAVGTTAAATGAAVTGGGAVGAATTGAEVGAGFSTANAVGVGVAGEGRETAITGA